MCGLTRSPKPSRPFPAIRPNAEVRQMLGRKGEVWIAESRTERIRVHQVWARVEVGGCDPEGIEYVLPITRRLSTILRDN